jgi:hypothetical protein
MLTRKAFIIGSPTSAHGNLPGVRADHENYRSFLVSPAGGAWEHSEISDIGSVTASDLERTILTAQRHDYSLVIFAGHGSYNPRIQETLVCINDKEEVAVSRLNTGTRRQLTIIDACRTVPIVELVEKLAARMDEFAKSLTNAYRASCRELYDQAIGSAEAGQSYVYSCSVNEAAGETQNGGDFSRALLRHAESWAERATFYARTRATESLSIREAFDGAVSVLKSRRSAQTPVLEEGRRLRSFPFAVK